MNGSTVGESDTNGHVSGQCQSCGLYTAYGAQFMIGSCQTSNVVTSTISRIGWRGKRRQRHHHGDDQQATIITMVPIWCRPSQW